MPKSVVSQHSPLECAFACSDVKYTAESGSERGVGWGAERVQERERGVHKKILA